MKCTKVSLSLQAKIGTSSGRMKMLPTNIEQLTRGLKVGEAILAKAGDDLWLSRRFEFGHFVLTGLGPLSLNYFTRAKGAGHISIDANFLNSGQGVKSFLQFDEFSDGYINSARKFSKELSKVLGYELEERDFGPDC